MIYDVSPTETPALTMFRKVPATGVKHEWQKHSLATASSTNFVLEGDDATNDTLVQNTRVYNYCCISDKVAQASGTMQAVSLAGRRDELAFDLMNRMKELKRDVDKIILENNAYVAGTATAARECAGMQAWIATNRSIAADATGATGDGSDAHTDGTARALLESYATTVLAACWSSGGMPTVAFMNSFQKQKFAGFSGNATRTNDGTKKTIVNTVDIYIDPLGNEVRLVPERQAPADVVYFVDLENVAFATLRDFQTSDLAKTGDSTRKQLVVEYTLEMCNEAAHGAINDLTTS